MGNTVTDRSRRQWQQASTVLHSRQGSTPYVAVQLYNPILTPNHPWRQSSNRPTPLLTTWRRNVGLHSPWSTVCLCVCECRCLRSSTPAADHLKRNVGLLYTAHSVFACVRASRVVIYVVYNTDGETGASPHTFAIWGAYLVSNDARAHTETHCGLCRPMFFLTLWAMEYCNAYDANNARIHTQTRLSNITIVNRQ